MCWDVVQVSEGLDSKAIPGGLTRRVIFNYPSLADRMESLSLAENSTWEPAYCSSACSLLSQDPCAAVLCCPTFYTSPPAVTLGHGVLAKREARASLYPQDSRLRRPQARSNRRPCCSPRLDIPQTFGRCGLTFSLGPGAFKESSLQKGVPATGRSENRFLYLHHGKPFHTPALLPSKDWASPRKLWEM